MTFFNQINIRDQTDTLNKVKEHKQTFYYLWDHTDTWNQVNGPIEHLSPII